MIGDPDVIRLVEKARTNGYEYLTDAFREYLEQVASAASIDAAHVRDAFSRACTRTGMVIAAAATWLRERGVPEDRVRLIISQ